MIRSIWLLPRARARLSRCSASRRGLHSSIASLHPTIFSGIQPTGVPHLGNYLGALRAWVRMQNGASPQTALYFSIVDLHSMTSRTQTPHERRQNRRQGFAALLACGLDPGRSVIFHQSAIPQHAELHWILSCEASMGALTRMTQWKTKLADSEPDGTLPFERHQNDNTERLRLGLFSYPVLQAADILLYNTTHVPVGEDQVQHIEFARSLATSFNSAFGGAKSGPFVIPECVVSPAKRIMSLTEPQKKMSKSHPQEKSRILISDDLNIIHKKLRSALTDSGDSITYDPTHRPGLSNLIELIAALDPDAQRSCQDVAQEFQRMNAQGTSPMRLVKERAAELVAAELGPVRERYLALTSPHQGKELERLEQLGVDKAQSKAQETIKKIKAAVGL